MDNIMKVPCDIQWRILPHEFLSQVRLVVPPPPKKNAQIYNSNKVNINKIYTYQLL